MKATDRGTLASLRLRSQLISSAQTRSAQTHSAQTRTAVEVVRWLTAMQAQDLPNALWSVALRMPGGTRDQVAAAFDHGEVVRSWPFRGTLHLVPGADLGWMLDLTAARTLTGAATRHRGLGLDSDTFDRARALAESALGSATALTRDELFAAFDAGGVSTQGQRGVHLLWYLAHTKTICFGPMVGPNGTNQALVLLDEWIGHPRALDRDESLGELVLRYFTSHGPATLKDFLWWSKVLVAEAKIGLELARPGLESIEVDGVEYWMAAGSLDADSAARSNAGRSRGGAAVYLLPGFDEYILGYTDRSVPLDAGHFERIVPGGNGMFLPTVVSAGRVVGTWSRKATTKQVAVTPDPFVTVTPAVERGIRRTAEAYARYSGVPLAPETKKAADPTQV